MKTTMIIDGGGTSTDAAVVHSGAVVARAQGASFKPVAGNLHTDDLCRYLGSFLIQHGMYAKVSRVLIGMSGIWGDFECGIYAQAVEQSWLTYVGEFVPTIVAVSDAELALLAGSPQHGSVLIAGTGSIVVGRTKSGSVVRVGGWGGRVDDGGGGFWLGRQALRAVARMIDGRGPDTMLIRPVAAFLRSDVDDLAFLQVKLRSASIDYAARLGRAVLTYAEEGDVVAQAIRNEGALELAELVQALHSSNPDVGNHIVTYGSLLDDTGYRSLVERYSTEYNQEFVIEPLGDVVSGLLRSEE